MHVYFVYSVYCLFVFRGFEDKMLELTRCYVSLQPTHQTRTINPLVTSGHSHPYHLDESISILRGNRDKHSFFISFFDEIHVNKQYSGVTSRAILFVYVP